MKTTAKAFAVTATAAASAGLAVTQIRRSRARAPEPGASAESRNRWRAVTVNKPAAEVAPDGNLPEPLAALGDRVEVRITPAPDGKGTEIGAGPGGIPDVQGEGGRLRPGRVSPGGLNGRSSW
jgi:hypothetical protein